MGLHAVEYGGLIYHVSIQDPQSGGSIYTMRLHDMEGFTPDSGGHELTLFTYGPTWGESYGTFIEDSSFNHAYFHNVGSTIDLSYAVKLTLRHNYFHNAWIPL